MPVCCELIEENLVTLEQSVKTLKSQFEHICEEWNDVEVALSDLNHFHEFLEFNPEGVIWLESERKKLFEERRVYKKLYHRILPHIKFIGELHKSIGEAAPPYEPMLYGIRSIRGYNLFQDIPKYVNEHNQQFADLTGTDTVVSHIFKPVTNANLFNRPPLDVRKCTLRTTELLIPPSIAITEHQSYANQEQRERWSALQGDVKETAEECSARIERELETSIRMGSNRTKKLGGL